MQTTIISPDPTTSAGPRTTLGLRTRLVEEGLTDTVEIVERPEPERTWTEPIGLLFIGGLEGTNSVSAAVDTFECSVGAGGYVVFADFGSQPRFAAAVEKPLVLWAIPRGAGC